MRIFIAGLALMVLGGCATSPVSVGEATPAPANRVSAYQKPVDGGGTIIVTRDSGFPGGGCFATVFLNGQPVAKLDPKEKASFKVPAGEWMVGAALEGKALCALNPERLEAEAIIRPGQTKKYRIYTSADGDVGVMPTTF